MENNSVFEEFEVKSNFARRRSLLPIWIKIFIWFFLIGGSVATILLMAGLFLNKVDLSLYGITATHPYNINGIFIVYFINLQRYCCLWTLV
jgi:hypothetical protein